MPDFNSFLFGNHFFYHGRELCLCAVFLHLYPLRLWISNMANQMLSPWWGFWSSVCNGGKPWNCFTDSCQEGLDDKFQHCPTPLAEWNEFHVQNQIFWAQRDVNLVLDYILFTCSEKSIIWLGRKSYHFFTWGNSLLVCMSVFFFFLHWLCASNV